MAGIRDSKTVGSTVYSYLTQNGKVVRQTWGNHTLDIIYDNQGTPSCCIYDGTKYIYVLNLQGDVIRLVSTTGSTVASYVYDAWGNIISSSGTMSDINPIRYRGYYYDTETKLYYLGSRYYDPAVRRFINADSADLAVANPYELTDKNYFAYCDNNPVMRMDDGGEFWSELLTGVAVVAGVTAVVALAVATAGTSIGVAAAVGGGTVFATSVNTTAATLAVTTAFVSATSYTYASKFRTLEQPNTSPSPKTPTYSKGGKQNIRDSGLAGVSNDEIDARLKNPKTPKSEKQRLKKEQKARGYRNKQKRSNGRSRTK